MSDVYTAAVERLSHIAGVRGALIVEAASAVPVAVELSEGVNGTAVAALAAAMFQRTLQAAESAQLGTLDSLQLEADEGHVVVVGADELILVVVAERDAQLGLVRLEALRAAGSLS
jgi:predicted regulator of Ras-like GTPase activity (Roadblock/LC7/MglB family)